jgi:hypothetical protein
MARTPRLNLGVSSKQGALPIVRSPRWPLLALLLALCVLWTGGPHEPSYTVRTFGHAHALCGGSVGRLTWISRVTRTAGLCALTYLAVTGA